MLPELVFQDVLYGLHIMVCSPLHLHGTAAWKPIHAHSFQQPSQVQAKPVLAGLKILQPKLITHRDAIREDTQRPSPVKF